MPKPQKHVFVCTQARPPGHPRPDCAKTGATEILQAFSQQFEEKGLWGKCAITSAGCLGACDYGPTVLVYPEGVLYGKVTPADVVTIVDEHLLADKPVAKLQVPKDVW